MAKTLRDEDLVLNIIVNGNQGKKEIGELARFIRDTKQEVSLLEQEEKKLRAAGKQNTEEFRRLTAELQKKGDAIKQAQVKMMQLGQSLKLTEMSSTDLKNAWTSLYKLMNKAVPGSADWEKYRNELTRVEERMAEVKEMSKRTNTTITEMAGKFNHYFGLLAAWTTGLVASLSGVKSAVNEFAKMDDTMGSVQKTTGLTKDEVKDLNEELKTINTRTGQEELLGLARIAGKLGLTGKEDIEGFVRATDQIVVALNEDLGGDVEETVNQVGKLVDIFNLKNEFGIEKSLLKVGSAINDLGAAGTANEGYLVNFAQRVAGVAPAAGISIQNILGFAATLDALGQEAEAAGTVFNNTIPDMFKNTQVYADAAGMSLSSFNDILQNDTNEAFIRVLEGIRGNNDGYQTMVQRLDALGVDGSRATAVLQALSNKTEYLREQQRLSNQSFLEGTSIGKEYNTMNSTAQAELEKSQKKLHLLVVTLGELFYPAMTASNNVMSMGINIISALVSFIGRHGKALAIITAAIIGYSSVLAYNIILEKARNTEATLGIALSKLRVFWDTTMTAAMHLLSAAYLVATGRIAAARAEMVLFNIVTKANPIGIIIAVLAAAGVALFSYKRSIEEARDAHKGLTDAALKQKNEVNSLTNTLNPLIKRYDELKSKASINKTEQRELQSIIQQLANKVPSAATAFDKYGNALDVNKKKVNEFIEGQKLLLNYQNKGAKQATIAEINRLAGLRYANQQRLNNMIKNGTFSNDQIQVMRNLVKQGSDDIDALRFKLKQLSGDFVDVGADDPGKPKVTESVTSKKLTQMTIGELKARLSDLNSSIDTTVKGSVQYKKVAQEIADIDKILNSEKIESKQGKKDQSEADRKKKESEKLIADQKAYQQEIIIAQKTLIEQENAAHEERLKKAGLFGKNREKLTVQELAALEALESAHQKKVDTIDADAIKKGLESKQKAFEKELSNIRIKNNLELATVSSLKIAKSLLEDDLSKEELSKITTLERAKKALKQQYQKEEDELTRQHLESLITELQSGIESGALDGIDLSDKIFSEEELAVLSERLGLAKEKLAELLAGLSGSGDEAAEKSKEFSFEKGKTDIFGLTQDDWELLFENFESGTIGIQGMLAAAQALIGAWSAYGAFVTASENKNLQKFEQSTNKKKESLDRRLKAGAISQENYNSSVEELDKQLDKKKADLALKQAKREKQIQVMSAITGTASAVVGALGNKPWTPLNFALAGIVAAAGAVQLGTILATPLPGKEDGGSLMDVTRSQDGKKFRAAYDPDKRGYVNRPTVITGETGSEFVFNNDAVNNPTVQPILDIVDTAQKNGTISSLNMEKILYQSASYKMSGRASGGYVSSSGTPKYSNTDSTSPDNDVALLLKQTLEATERLTKQLEKPIVAQVALLGPDGFVAKNNELTELQKNTKL